MLDYEYALEIYERYSRIRDNEDKLRICSELFMVNTKAIKTIVEIFDNRDLKAIEALKAGKHPVQRPVNHAVCPRDYERKVSNSKVEKYVSMYIIGGRTYDEVCELLQGYSANYVKNVYSRTRARLKRAGYID